MNKLTTEAFSAICRNEDVFEFTQTHGMHGVAIFSREDPSEVWFNPKLVHSLGYNEPNSLSWKKIISSEDTVSLKHILYDQEFLGEIIAGELDFLHSKGFIIPMTYKAIQVEEKVIIAVNKISDYSQVEYDPNLDFQKGQLLETILETINVGIMPATVKGNLHFSIKLQKNGMDYLL